MKAFKQNLNMEKGEERIAHLIDLKIGFTSMFLGLPIDATPRTVREAFHR